MQIEPTLRLTLFSLRTKTAVAKIVDTRPVYGNSQTIGMRDSVESYLLNMRDHDTKGYLTFTTYARNHSKDDVLQCSAIMLEYPYALKAKLLERLSELPYIHFLIDSQSDFDAKAEARILVAFPLAQPITKAREYTRIASLLWDEIGLDAHTKGDIAITFLFAPYINRPSVTLVDADRVFLEPSSFLAQNRGNWVDARHKEETIEKLAPASDALFIFPGE